MRNPVGNLITLNISNEKQMCLVNRHLEEQNRYS